MRYLILLITVIVFLGILSTYIKDDQESSVCFNENCFDVEIAITPEERARGLMFRENLDDNRGMLFIFEEEDIHPFWMRNTLIPLDIIWIDSNNKVVFISRNTQPCGETCPIIEPDEQSIYVLEINAGISERIGLDIGNELIISR